MSIIEAQFCQSTLPFHQMLVSSDSRPDLIHTVTVPFPGDPPEDWYCSCESWIHRGYCKHRAKVKPCGWDALGGPEGQSQEQEDNHICPRCGGPTYHDLVEDDE